MNIPKVLINIAEVIDEFAALSPESDSAVVIPLRSILEKDESTVLVDKRVLEKALRRLEELQVIRLVNTSDLRSHILPLSSDRIVVEVAQDKLNEFLDQESKQAQTSEDETLKRGDLVLNLTTATLQFQENKPVNISPDNKEIKLLVLLMSNKRVVKYGEVAKDLEFDYYDEKELQDKHYARDVHFIKRSLNKILKNAGMTKEEISKVIIPVKNKGYKLNLS